MILSLVFYFTLCLYSHVESLRTFYGPGHIVGGEPANIEDIPYQLALFTHSADDKVNLCGASIIDSSWALTAAHCVFGYSEDRVLLQSGSTYVGVGGTFHHVQKVIIHPMYRHQDVVAPFDYDVAVLKVSNPFHYSEVAQRIEMASETPPTGSRAVVAGWGDWNYEDESPDQLQKLDMHTMEYENCRQIYGNYPALTPRMICTYVPEGGKHVYYGDSGGPLVVDNIQVGIASSIIPEQPEAYPNMYTDVAKIRNWVTSTIENE